MMNIITKKKYYIYQYLKPTKPQSILKFVLCKDTGLYKSHSTKRVFTNHSELLNAITYTRQMSRIQSPQFTTSAKLTE